MLTQMVEHRGDKPVLAAEVTVDQAVIHLRARRDIPDRSRRQTALGEQVGCGPQNGRDDFFLAHRCIGAP
jgi:hypothetical protein